jgi:sucrose-6-phosphate hydrolase SacC (GH32 family)
LHFTAPGIWMNDPNGLVFHDGEYHLFYQCNPFGPDFGNLSWGHAVSRDLVRWEHLPVAIAATGDEQVYSGSAVLDGERMVAVYTAARPGHQAIALAISHDRGRSFERFAGNPVLDIGSADFRDPKVFRHGERWVMAVALAVERRIQFYESPDLVAWRHLSDFASDALPGGHWECPDLFELDGRWVLIVSVFPGSAWYFVGDFDGTRFVAESCERLDHGTDFYAPVTFNDAPARVLIGWMNHWDRAASVPGPMSTPRVLSLRDGELLQEPVDQQGTVLELRAGDARVLVGPQTVEVFSAGRTSSHRTV